MRFLDLFKKKQQSASVAKERLQILVSHERAARNAPSWLPDLKNDILEVIKKYVEVEPDAISFNVGKEEHRDVLELNIALPERK
ncbi:MAG: cell division topological specificity factor MinE [Proteobacteria bacterium]|nr:MAG: cell division topological specificity factor MinE [Pseudomonadota bacterium]